MSERTFKEIDSIKIGDVQLTLEKDSYYLLVVRKGDIDDPTSPYWGRSFYAVNAANLRDLLNNLDSEQLEAARTLLNQIEEPQWLPG